MGVSVVTTLRENKKYEIYADEKKEKYLIRRLSELSPEKLEYVIRGLKERLPEKNRKKLKEIVNDDNLKVLNINEVKEKIKKQKEYLMNNFYVKNIGVFGSYARGEQNSYSDIDLVVHFFTDKKIGFKIVSLKDYLEDVLNKSVDLINYDSMSEKIKKNVEKEVIYLWEEISEN
jgi:hypothetical protein